MKKEKRYVVKASVRGSIEIEVWAKDPQHAIDLAAEVGDSLSIEGRGVCYQDLDIEAEDARQESDWSEDE